MARPRRNNADYFSHDSDMRNDIKIKALRRKFGHQGYAVWCFLLETLTNADYFELDFSDINKELLAADFDISIDDLTEIVGYCVRISLLQLESGKLCCKKLNERMSGLIKRRDNVTVTSENTKKENPANEFAPPSLSEVGKFIRENNFSIDAEKFYNFYSAKAWKIGNNPMADWQAAVKTWEHREKHCSTQDSPTPTAYRPYVTASEQKKIDERKMLEALSLPEREKYMKRKREKAEKIKDVNARCKTLIEQLKIVKDPAMLKSLKEQEASLAKEIDKINKTYSDVII